MLKAQIKDRYDLVGEERTWIISGEKGKKNRGVKWQK